MNQTKPHKRAMLIAFSVLCCLALIASGGTLYYGVDGSTGSRVKCKTSTTPSASVQVPNSTPEPLAFLAADTVTATHTASVITYAANATKKHVIYGISWSYTGGTVSGGNIKVEDVSGTTVFSQDIDARGQGVILFPRPLRGSAINTALIITLADGGASVVGKVSILGHDLETP